MRLVSWYELAHGPVCFAGVSFKEERSNLAHLRWALPAFSDTYPALYENVLSMLVDKSMQADLEAQEVSTNFHFLCITIL